MFLRKIIQLSETSTKEENSFNMESYFPILLHCCSKEYKQEFIYKIIYNDAICGQFLMVSRFKNYLLL